MYVYIYFEFVEKIGSIKYKYMYAIGKGGLHLLNDRGWLLLLIN